MLPIFFMKALVLMMLGLSQPIIIAVAATEGTVEYQGQEFPILVVEQGKVLEGDLCTLMTQSDCTGITPAKPVPRWRDYFDPSPYTFKQ